MSVFDNATEHQALIDEAAETLRARIGTVPEVLVVAGSGLGGLTAKVQDAQSVSYEELKHFPQSTVVGHAGKLVWGKLGGKPAVVMSGRKHVYEGVDVRQTIVPLRALLRAGVKTVLLSNAAGSMNRFILPGDLMLITDHINFQFRAPLEGPNLSEMGPRFPDVSAPYDPGLCDLARQAALDLGVSLKEGVYVALTGPTYETQAEVGMYKQFADAVGMSTVPETLAAAHAGARVLAISAITNSHVQRKLAVTTHEEVIETGKQVGDAFCRLVEEIIRRA
ncbi:MAG: purine-nucleoside phosphorylase [Candidatus Sumerlaeota bacterium]|nr:purine-nucleoside phosphorylase [Candidatus Sumerlaeota bacterium]